MTPRLTFDEALVVLEGVYLSAGLGRRQMVSIYRERDAVLTEEACEDETRRDFPAELKAGRLSFPHLDPERQRDRDRIAASSAARAALPEE